jgi:hypothetical protein
MGIAPSVRVRIDEMMQQIAVGGVDFDSIESRPYGAVARVDKRLHHGFDVSTVHYVNGRCTGPVRGGKGMTLLDDRSRAGVPKLGNYHRAGRVQPACEFRQTRQTIVAVTAECTSRAPSHRVHRS